MKTIKKFLLLSVFAGCLSHAGAVVNDFQFRTGLKINKAFRKGFDLSAAYELRLYKNAGAFKGSYFTVNPSYKLDKHFGVELEARYAVSHSWDKYRLGAGLSYKKDFGRIKGSLLARYQVETFNQSWPEIGQYPSRQNYRLKAELSYKVSKPVKMYGSCEPRYQVVEQEGMLQRVKTQVGSEWEFIKHHTLDVSYAYQPEYEPGHTFTAWILEATYSWDIPKGKKPKKNTSPAGTK
jgi:hypothetical protein